MCSINQEIPIVWALIQVTSNVTQVPVTQPRSETETETETRKQMCFPKQMALKSMGAITYGGVTTSRKGLMQP